MKNLANCKPSEFLRQTNKIRKVAEEWLKTTEFLKILQRKAEQVPLDISATSEERAKAFLKNRELAEKQTRENISDALDKVLEEYPEKTIELLALLCFIEPEDADNHPMSEYIGAVGELIGNQEVISFFTSLMQLGQMGTSNASEA